ncbi:MAG: hypothetical protein U0586_16820 [Candidatus Brocadiaceae bacterium]
MELTINKNKIKNLIKESIVEMIKEDREGFRKLILEAIENAGLANAIEEGRKNTFISEDKIMGILKG